MRDAPALPIFDGHNDVLLSLHLAHRGGGRGFFERGERGHLDLPRAVEGGFAGGFFAVFVPNPRDGSLGPDEPPPALPVETGYEHPLPPPCDPAYAQRTAIAVAARLFRLEAESAGRLKVVRTARELSECLRRGVLAAVLHFEGAEAIDPELDALEVFYRAGLRSLGIVWSRPNAFGHGVPFAFPRSPDTGPGLTEAGRDLVRACNRLGILVDLSHLNERGFWDVAGLSTAPLVATHSNAHAVTPSTRNLLDAQLDAIKASGGIVGVNFSVAFSRQDGRPDADTPLDALVRHFSYLADRMGVEHVAFGSDFDGTTVPRELGDAAGLPRLVDALRGAGFGDADLRKLGTENWLRVLQQTWKG